MYFEVLVQTRSTEEEEAWFITYTAAQPGCCDVGYKFPDGVHVEND